MTTEGRPNIYEGAGAAPLDAEAERLRSFAIPTAASVSVLELSGGVNPGSIILDIGSGENPGLNSYAHEHGAQYIAVDTRSSAVQEQKGGGADMAVVGDIREFPFGENKVDIAHARFILAHFDRETRSGIIADALKTVKPGGRAVFIDYDWTVVRGSDVMNRFRDFIIENIKVFDAQYGPQSQSEIAAAVGSAAIVQNKLIASPKLFDYKPVLGLLTVTLQGLEASRASQEVIDQASAIFDDLQVESESDNPPGFWMPDMVAAVATKA